MGLSYYKTFPSDDVIYSLDMVRYNFEISPNQDGVDSIEEFNKWINRVNLDISRYNVSYSRNFNQYKYRHLWAIRFMIPSGTEASITIMLDLGRNREDRFKGAVEFNPNKCEVNEYFNSFWREFISYLSTMTLVRYDCAIDIPLPRNQVFMIRNQRNDYHLILDRLCSKTEYQGKRDHQGYVKLYDKTCESKLDYDLTRCEITFNRDAFTIECNKKIELPDIAYCDLQLSLDLNDELTQNEKALVSLIKNSNDINYWLTQITFRKRKKIEPYLANKILSFDISAMVSVRSLALSYEFCSDLF